MQRALNDIDGSGRRRLCMGIVANTQAYMLQQLLGAKDGSGAECIVGPTVGDAALSGRM